MLKQLRITNLILIESTEISFSEGFNVLSGETGSGKSAIMSSLSLVMGDRADFGMIRKGCEKGIVEAIFDAANHPSIMAKLEQAGIDILQEEEILIRREILSSGKSRCFINHQLAHVSLLKQLGDTLIQIIGQHANQQLISLEKQMEIVDLYGNLNPLLADFSSSLHQENNIKKELKELIENESKRLREIEVCRMELTELEEANLKEGEEEALFEEYSLLASAEERSSKIYEVLSSFTGDRGAILPILNRHKGTLEHLTQLDPSFEETSKSYENALLEIQEIVYTLRNKYSQLEKQPEKLSILNDRLELLTRLKRKYGATLQEIQTYQEMTEKRLEDLETTDLKIEDLQQQLQAIQEKTQQLATALTQQRIEVAKKLEQEVVKQLRALNMPKVDFTIELLHQKRSSKGDDRIEFFLIPNVGEHRISIRECASGGELARIMLALQTLLAGKDQVSILVFDEIDSNIGGETASIVGKKLKEIGQKHQILCITHFAQVAQEAEHHLQISKQEVEGRTFTLIKKLDQLTRPSELSRMQGELLHQ